MKFAFEEAALWTCRNVAGDRRTPPDAAIGIRPSLRDPWPRTGLTSSPPSSRDYAQSATAIPTYITTHSLPPARTHTSLTHNTMPRKGVEAACSAYYNKRTTITSRSRFRVLHVCSHHAAAGFTVLRNSLICFSLVSGFSIQHSASEFWNGREC